MNREQIIKEIQGWQFAKCPTEEKEPFFWKWNKSGLDILACGIGELLEAQRKELVEEIEKIDVSGGGSGRRLKTQIMQLLK